MLKLPSAFGYQPSYAGVMLAPRSRGGSSGRCVCGRCALTAAQLVNTPRQAAIAQRRSFINTDALRSQGLSGGIYSTFRVPDPPRTRISSPRQRAGNDADDAGGEHGAAD